MVLHGTNDAGASTLITCENTGIIRTIDSAHFHNGGGELLVSSTNGVPINMLMDNGGQQALRGEDGRLRVDTHINFNGATTHLDNVSVGQVGALNYGVFTETKKRSVVIYVKNHVGATLWNLQLYESLDNANFVSNQGNLNGMGGSELLMEIQISAPYWKLVLHNQLGATGEAHTLKTIYSN